MMSEWSVYIEVEGEPNDSTIEQEKLEDLLDILRDYHIGSVSFDELRFGGQLTVEASDVRSAMETASEVWNRACEKADLPKWQIVRLEVMTMNALDRELQRPTIPPLIGVSEAARVLGVSKQRVSELARSRHFPRPLAELGAGPVWTEAAIFSFANSWDRRPGPKTL